MGLGIVLPPFCGGAGAKKMPRFPGISTCGYGISKAGLEDYLAYEAHGVGRAGTGYVSLFNGNLVFEHQDTTTAGNILPVSVRHVYNSCYRAANPFRAGYGWKMDWSQAMGRESVDRQQYYVWLDGDGTEVYFTQEGGEWKDTTGREMTLRLGATEAVIADRAGGERAFALPTAELDGSWANAKPLKLLRNALGPCRSTARG